MQRITRDHTVGPDRRYNTREPVAEVDLGEPFLVETINFRTPIIRTPQDANPARFREREETGPIYIRGISPGDSVAVQILSIRPDGHASGGWWRDPEENAFLPIQEGRVSFPGGLWAPVHMMLGDIYVTPANSETPNPWDNGGNMDFRDVSAGHTLCLRSQLEGGLLVLGDAHAAQGDGEILGLGAECAAEAVLRVTRDETMLSERPLIIKAESFVAIASRPDYAEARDLAVQDASRVLTRLKGCTEQEAYLYVTTVGHLRNGAVWHMGRADSQWLARMPLTVGVEVPLLD